MMLLNHINQSIQVENTAPSIHQSSEYAQYSKNVGNLLN